MVRENKGHCTNSWSNCLPVGYSKSRSTDR